MRSVDAARFGEEDRGNTECKAIWEVGLASGS